MLFSDNLTLKKQNRWTQKKKGRIDQWINVQKYGTLNEIIALQSPQEYCDNDDKPYIIIRLLEEKNAIQANMERQKIEERRIIDNKYLQKKEVLHL